MLESSVSKTIEIEYVWFTNSMPRSKTRICEIDDIKSFTDNEQWKNYKATYDGSSTDSVEHSEQNTDVILMPIRLYKSYRKDSNHFVLLCECMSIDNIPEKSNYRRALMGNYYNNQHEVMIGFEQEYFLIENNENLDELQRIYESSKSEIKFYCGAGECKYRNVVRQHTQYCINAGVKIQGTNAEVVNRQWEFQILGDILQSCDDLMMARYLLYIVAEENNMKAILDPKPFVGVNGSGCHTNISTKYTRKNMTNIDFLIQEFSKCHLEFIERSGKNNSLRLSGTNETSSIKTFSSGTGTRHTSVRIPILSKQQNLGYFEDRRPAANVDPYLYCSGILSCVNKNYQEQHSKY